MSVHSEVNNLLKNKSGNASLSIRSRLGDTEDGAEFFDMQANAAPTAIDVLQEKDERKARQKFLCKYFALLKQWLNRFEFEFVKQLYVEGRDENTIFEMLGLSPKRFKKGLQKKLAEHSDEVKELVERSEWEDAELFSCSFFTSPTEIYRDKKLLEAKPKTVKGFGNLVKAQSRRNNYLQVDSDRRYQRKVYMRGYVRGKHVDKFETLNKFYEIIDRVLSYLKQLSPALLEALKEFASFSDDEETKQLILKEYYCKVYQDFLDFVINLSDHYKKAVHFSEKRYRKYVHNFDFEDNEIITICKTTDKKSSD